MDRKFLAEDFGKEGGFAGGGLEESGMEGADLSLNIWIAEHRFDGIGRGKDFAEFFQGGDLQSLGAEKIFAGNGIGVGAEDVFGSDTENDFGWGDTEDLAGKDMFKAAALSLVGDFFIFETVAADEVFKEAPDDFGDEEAGLHVGVDKFLIGVVEDARVLGFEGVNDLDDDGFGCKDLVGALGRNEVENIFVVSAGKVVSEFVFALEKFDDSAVEDGFAEKFAAAQGTELVLGEAGDFEESFIVGEGLEIF